MNGAAGGTVNRGGGQRPSMTGDLVVYGSYGYTGSLVAQTAIDRGLDPLLAGRNRDAVTDQGIRLDCESEVVALDEPRVLDMLLEDADAVLHCAGPFADTAAPMAEACLRTGTHYLDVTGEIDVLEALAGRDEDFREAGAVCLPAVAADVVPTDCLAAHLADRLPEATHLELAFDAEVGVSPGTAKTALRHIGDGGTVRRDGEIVSRPPVHRWRTVDFGWDRAERDAAAIPWGDVSTAYHTTGIPNVTVYMATTASTARLQRVASHLAPVLQAGPVQSLLEWLVDRRVQGPDADERAGSRTYFWGEARTDDGDRVASRLRGPHTYDLTAQAAVGVAERVLSDPPAPGFHTPAGAFGPDLILEVTDAEREDVAVETGPADRASSTDA